MGVILIGLCSNSRSGCRHPRCPSPVAKFQPLRGGKGRRNRSWLAVESPPFPTNSVVGVGAASSHKTGSEAVYVARAVDRDVARGDAMEHRGGHGTGGEFVVNRIRITLGASHLLIHQRLNSRHDRGSKRSSAPRRPS